jgi:hypothetical protein
MTSGGFNFRDVFFRLFPCVQSLARQVGELDVVEVDDGQPSNTCSQEEFCDTRSDSPDSDYCDMGA